MEASSDPVLLPRRVRKDETAKGLVRHLVDIHPETAGNLHGVLRFVVLPSSLVGGAAHLERALRHPHHLSPIGQRRPGRTCFGSDRGRDKTDEVSRCARGGQRHAVFLIEDERDAARHDRVSYRGIRHAGANQSEQIVLSQRFASRAVTLRQSRFRRRDDDGMEREHDKGKDKDGDASHGELGYFGVFRLSARARPCFASSLSGSVARI